MDKSKFFSTVRSSIFSGSLSDSQVKGMEAILDECTKQSVTDLRHVAYILATPMIETGGTYEPITESLNYSAKVLVPKFGSRITQAQANQYGYIKNSAGVKIQKANEEAIGNIIYGGEWGRKNLGNTQPGDGYKFRGRHFPQLTGRRLYEIFGYADNPDAINQGAAGAGIMVKAMKEGIFTGKKLSDYLNASSEDWINSRRTVNGTDRAADIAKYAKLFYSALKAAS